MSDKTELLIVEVEKHPILCRKGRRDFKDAEKKKNAWKLIAKENGYMWTKTFLKSRNLNYTFLNKTEQKRIGVDVALDKRIFAPQGLPLFLARLFKSQLPLPHPPPPIYQE